MKKFLLLSGILSAAIIFAPCASAQTGSGFRGQSMNGSTGLFSIPSGRVGWEGAENFGLDIGYRAIINNTAGTSHIPALTASFFKLAQLSLAFDFQPEYDSGDDRKNNDLLLGVKIKLPAAGNTAIAAGGNVQILNIANGKYSYNAYQPYLAITYPGAFFAMTAETTIVFGKTFYSGEPNNNSDIDFGMGFDLILFPDVFGNAVHWLIDFANFGYSDNAWPNYSHYHTSAVSRGVLNTGFRIDLSVVPSFNNFKFLIDLVFNDLFDDGSRSFTIGAVFGFSAP